MRVVRIHEPGGPDVLTLDELDVGDPRPGEVRVRVESAGVNFIDTYHRAGVYPRDLPAAIGVEAGGVVDAVGPGVTTVAGGDRVVYCDQAGA